MTARPRRPPVDTVARQIAALRALGVAVAGVELRPGGVTYIRTMDAPQQEVHDAADEFDRWEADARQTEGRQPADQAARRR